jgi:integrase
VTVADAGDRYLHHLEHVMQRAPSTVQDYRIMVARGYTATNPVAAVDRPPAEGTDPDIRFLTLDELEAVVREVPDDTLGPTDRALYLTAAMPGLGQGELIALRWRDIDWMAARVRVRRKRYRGRTGKPKSRRGSRSVPLANRVARELELHFQRTRLQDDDDLVFAHPETSGPYDTSKLRKRYDAAVAAAGVRDDVVFHDSGTLSAPAWPPPGAAQDVAGVARPPRLQDDADLRRLHARRPSRGRARRAWLRRVASAIRTRLGLLMIGSFPAAGVT